MDSYNTKRLNQIELDTSKFFNIKMIALDLDGTTLTRSGLTRRTKETLEKVIESGISVVIATGRPYTALPKEILEIKGLKYLIISNGAHIVDIKGNFLYSNYADKEPILKICEILEKDSVPVEIFTEGAAYIDNTLYEDLATNGSTFMSAKYVLRTRRPVEGIFDFLREHCHKIENINLHFHCMEKRQKMWEHFRDIEGITVTSSQHNNLEIGGETTSKAEALRVLSERENLSLKQIMAFGDSPNDEKMLQEVGYGIAVENAVKEIKDVADYITLTNEEEGVCFAIRSLIFQEFGGVPRRTKKSPTSLKNLLTKDKNS